MDKIEEAKRRCKVVYLPCNFVVQVLQGLDWGDYFKVPVFEQIPAGAVVMSVAPFPARDAIGLIVSHQSFERTEQGELYPELVLDKVTYRRVKVRKVEN